MNSLNTLLFVYASLLGVNSLVSGLLWYGYKTRISALTFCVWTFATINFLLQGVFQAHDIWMVLSFMTYFPVSICLCLIFKEISFGQPSALPRRYVSAAVAGLALICIGTYMQAPFTATALIAAGVISYPMFDMGMRAVKRFSKNHVLLNVYSILLIVNALHFLDYPFLRNSPSTAIIGFSVALLITFAFSVLIPLSVLRLSDQRHAQYLEDKVRERTRELEIANLQLQEALSQNDNLLNIVCHDIASPLMIAKLNIEKLLLKTSDSSEDLRAISKSLHKIKLSTMTMQEVLEQVRKLHVLDLQHMQLELAPVDIHQAILEVFKLLEDRMEEKSLGLEIINTTERPVRVRAEKTILQNNVFLNLVTNAIKFSHQGGKIRIEIGEDNEAVLIRVKDEGIGIPKDMQHSIFELKSKTSRSGTNGEVGTGLGLPIVKRCLDQFNATIHCLSVEADTAGAVLPSGTQFEIRFPKAS